MIARLLPAALALACAGCASLGSEPASEPVAIGEQPSPQLSGLWYSEAPGWILAIGADGATLYDATSAYCSKDPVLPLGEIYTRYAFASEDELRFYEAGKDTFEMFRRIERLPELCRQDSPSGPLANFDAFAAFAEHYPFFAQHGIDWQARVAAARSSVGPATGDAELFTILSGLLDGLADGHIQMFGEVDGERRAFAPYPGPTLAITDPADAALRAQDPSAPRFLSRYRTAALDDILGGEGTSTANGLLVYGRVGPEGDVGYINLIAFDGLADGGWIAQREAIVAAITEALASFTGTRALIFDISNNRGGVNIAAQAAAGFFTDRVRQVAALSRPGQLRQPIRIVPQQAFYGKPVYLLTSNVTVSAGETFTLSLRAFPQVTHVGERTRGAMSKILPKVLPNGWMVYLSNQSYFDAEGRLWEGRGIPPAIEFEVFDRGDPDRGHAQAVRKVVALIGDGAE